MATLKEKKYTESQKVKDSYKNYTDYKNNKKPEDYAFSDAELLKETQDKYFNYEDFSYDVNSDPAYNQYKQIYKKQGKEAMEDTVGNTSALTGGYANSYAQTAGNIAYNKQLDKLNNVIPELYSAAYSKYEDELNRLESKLGYLSDKNEAEYSKYLDAYNFYTDEVNALRDLYLAEYANDMEIQESEWESAYKIAMKEQQKAISDAEIGYKYYAANLAQAQFDAELAYKQEQAALDDKYREYELRLQRREIDNENAQFWAEFDEKNKETIKEDELFVILGNSGHYEAIAALDMNYEDDQTVRYKALAMGIDKKYVDAYFDAKY